MFLGMQRVNPYNLPAEGRVQRPSSGVYEEPSNIPLWTVQQSPPTRGQLHGSGDLWGEEEGEDIDPYAMSQTTTVCEWRENRVWNVECSGVCGVPVYMSIPL